MKIVVENLTQGIRADSYLSDFFSEISRSKIQKMIKNECFLVNDSVLKSSYILKNGDVIESVEEIKSVCDMNDDINILPEDINLDIVWEDENMAVVNKPSGMLTHPTTTENSGTLVNALLYKYGENLSDLNGNVRRGIVHRLDRNTSGLIMIAKNNQTHEFLSDEMKNKNFRKKYVAVVKGILQEDEFEINTPIGRHITQPHKMAVNGKDAKESLTQVKVLQRLKSATFVDILLVTGRTHQIRVHFSSIGHPVYNDTLYGFGKMKIKTEEQVLQSYSLEFTKPFTQERIHLEIPYDEKITKVVNALT